MEAKDGGFDHQVLLYDKEYEGGDQSPTEGQPVADRYLQGVGEGCFVEIAP